MEQASNQSTHAFPLIFFAVTFRLFLEQKVFLYFNMSEVYDRCERQYCELSANLTKKCGSVTLLDGEKKKQKVSEIRTGLEEAESLIRKMELEARSLQPNIKVVLLASLKEYKSDLYSLKNEVKRISSNIPNQDARDELLETGMAHVQSVSDDQRARLLASSEKLSMTGERIRQGQRTMLEAEEQGISILQDLHQQRQPLLQAHYMVHEVNDNISRSKRIIRNISGRMNRNKWIISSIMVVLVIVISLILYFKLSK